MKKKKKTFLKKVNSVSSCKIINFRKNNNLYQKHNMAWKKNVQFWIL